MPRGGRRSTSFKPGNIANPKGRPKLSPELKSAKDLAKAEIKSAIVDVKAAAKECTEDAVKTLRDIMKDSQKPAAARVGAATALLDRGWGKPMQPVEASISLFDQMTDDEQKIMLAALSAVKAAEDEQPTMN